jgi:hypothetical protein
MSTTAPEESPPLPRDAEKTEGPFSLSHVLCDELNFINDRRSVLQKCGPMEIGKKAKPRLDPASLDLSEYYKEAHKLGLSAICLSGGGIRSAAFAFGVLQGLATRDVLKNFDFLSTVSGGGYAGSFLTAWVQRSGFEKVTEQLHLSSTPKQNSPIAYIRRYSKYLTPHSGLLSADVLAVVALFARNLFLNWLIIFPFVVAAIIFVKLAAIAVWWLSSIELLKTYPALFSTVSIAFLGSAFVDSLRLRPGWESETSEGLQFIDRELIPVGIGALFAMMAALTFFAQPGPHSWPIIVFNVAGTGAVTALTVWLVAFYFSQQTLPVERTTLSSIGSEKVPTYVIGTAISFTISGLVSGLAAAAILFLSTFGFKYISMELSVVVFGLPLVVSALFLGELVYTGLTSDAPWADGEREWLARAAGYHGLMSGSYLIIFGVILLGSPLVFKSIELISFYGPTLIATAGGISGVLIAVLGKAPATAALVTSAERSWKDVSYEVVLAIATPIFIVSLLVLISAGLDFVFLNETYLSGSILKDRVGLGRSFAAMLAAMLGLSVLGYGTSIFVNINRFSLHSVYRNRLIRTFLGASNFQRYTNAFTDFDEHDNIKLCNIWPGRGYKQSLAVRRDPELGSKEEDMQTPSDQPPPNLLVINMALNVLATSDLQLQERRALPFFATPRWIGSSDVDQPQADKKTPKSRPKVPAVDNKRPIQGSFRKAEDYGGTMTLGTAITISGAAASPNMGYHSSPSLGVILTLLNVRLGAWLGNPGPAGNKSYEKTSPDVAAMPLLREALGLTTAQDKYVYLSDGGHFENLAAYEMLRRRCKFILICDAGCDPTYKYEYLGNLVRKAYIDFGIRIDFRAPTGTEDKVSPSKSEYLSVADVHYPEEETPKDGAAPRGLLLYLKPCLCGNWPASVRSYWNLHPEFPHEPTVNQWFGESQFEAYRALGAYAIESTFPQLNPSCGISELFASLDKQSDLVTGRTGENS